MRFNPRGVKLSGVFPKFFTDFSEFSDKKFVITVPTAVIYRSFETLDNLTLMEGNAEGNYSALVPGKVTSRFSQVLPTSSNMPMQEVQYIVPFTWRSKTLTSFYNEKIFVSINK